MDEKWIGIRSLQIIQKSVDEGASPIAHTRMDHQARLLVDNDNIVILIDNIQGNFFRNKFKLVWRLGKKNADNIEGFDAIVRLHWFVVHHDTVGLRRQLNLVTRNTLQVHLQIFVDT